MAVFSAKNFPRDVGENHKFTGAGERTTYVPTGDTLTNYKYKQGFQTAKSTLLFGKKGEIVKWLPAGTTVFFVHPAELFNAKDLGIVSKYILAGVSLKSHNDQVDGYVAISAVIKPPGKNQGRVGSGSRTQDMVANYIKDYCYKNKIEVEDSYKVAPMGSTRPDLIMTIAGKEVQFEIKGTNNSTAPITFFDKSVKRTAKTPAIIDDIAYTFANTLRLPVTKRTDAFVGLIDYFKTKDPTVGFAGDQGTPKSGKLPSELTTTNYSILNEMRKVILRHFDKDTNSDDFFVVHDRLTDKFNIYYVGVGEARNVLNADPLPNLKSFSLATYGGVSSGSTRVGLKIKLS